LEAFMGDDAGEVEAAKPVEDVAMAA